MSIRGLDTPELCKIAQDVDHLLANGLTIDHNYHNFTHTMQVFAGVHELCSALHIEDRQTELLKIAALLHDIGFTMSYQGHEQHSVGMAIDYLKSLHFHRDDIQVIATLIAATSMPQIPTDIHEQIICDADMSHFSRRDYPQLLQLLRREWEAFKVVSMEDVEWYPFNVKFLEKHRYFTDYAREQWGAAKDLNLKWLRSCCMD